MRWVGNHVRRADAKWVGSLLAQLSTKQIQDAFRAAHYSPEMVSEFTKAVQARIEQLKEL
jgi:transposase-like protein